MPKGLKGFQKGYPSYWKGKKMTQEVKKKMSVSRKLTGAPWRKGMKMEEETKDKIRKKILERKERFGYINSQETREKISDFHKGKKWNWKGGTRNWLTRQTKIRDDYTCQICSLRDVEIMEVDHIKNQANYPELKFVLDNLITLCPNCHRRKTNREIREGQLKRRKNDL